MPASPAKPNAWRSTSSNHAAVIEFCKRHAVDLVVVGPETPLAAGIVDDLTAHGIKAFGPSKTGGTAGGLQGIHQGALHGVRHSDRRLWPLRRCGRGAGLCPRPRRADRGQGRRACRRQGRGGRSNLARSRGRHRHDVRWRVRCCGRRGRDRGVSLRPRDQLLCAVRRRDRDRARFGAGPQAGVRPRPGAEHRRHGRLFADAVRDAGDPCRDHGEDHPAHGDRA